MSSIIKPAAEWCAAIVEAVGIGIITAITLYVLIFGVIRMLQGRPWEKVFHIIRQRLGRGILLGLEFLVAADIIHTVAVELSFETVGVLAIIVVIRTFLSFTLELEISGKWPWQEKATSEE